MLDTDYNSAEETLAIIQQAHTRYNCSWWGHVTDKVPDPDLPGWLQISMRGRVTITLRTHTSVLYGTKVEIGQCYDAVNLYLRPTGYDDDEWLVLRPKVTCTLLSTLGTMRTNFRVSCTMGNNPRFVLAAGPEDPVAYITAPIKIFGRGLPSLGGRGLPLLL
jgi:hypothetical protein